MKKKYIFLVLTLCILLGITSCGDYASSAGEDVEVSTGSEIFDDQVSESSEIESEEDAQQKNSADGFASKADDGVFSPDDDIAFGDDDFAFGEEYRDTAFSLEDYTTSPWQDAYIAKLQEMCDADIRQEENYSVYDIDGNGMPELFIFTSTSEGDSKAKIFTYQDDEARQVGELHMGHTGMYSYPSENAILLWFAHMGAEEIKKIVFSDGVLGEPETIYAGKDIENGEYVGYSDIRETVPKAESISLYPVKISLPYVEPMVLPILEYEVGHTKTGDVGYEEECQVAIEEVRMSRREMFNITSGGYSDSLGWLFLDDYCIGLDTDKMLWPVSYILFDLNKDGQNECIVKIAEGFADDDFSILILSYQDGIVYAYKPMYVGSPDLLSTGLFYDSDYSDMAFEMFFNKNNFYRRSVKPENDYEILEWRESR